MACDPRKAHANKDTDDVGDEIPRRVVCFAAHPDDLEFTCTGLLDRFIAAGAAVVYVVVTDGANGFKDGAVPADERVRIREAEQRDAARALGVETVIFLGERDGFLIYTEALRASFVGILREHRPDAVLTFDPANRAFDNLNLFHRDHRVVAEATFDACFAAKNRSMYDGAPHRIGKLWFFGTDKPNTFVDVTAFMPRKLEILARHTSQFDDFGKVESLIHSLHRDWAAARTAVNGNDPGGAPEFCEAFRVVNVEQLI